MRASLPAAPPGKGPARPAPLWLRDAGLVAAVLMALVFGHRQALARMVDTWNVSPMYSYGFTVPVISAFLLWSRRAELARLTVRPSWAGGLAVMAGGIGLSVAARAAGIHVLDQVAFLISLAGAVLLLFGGACVKAAWAALAYLLLMVPIWDGLTETLHDPFQLRSAGIGVWLLQAAGVPAYREGTLITLPNLSIEVARACSGVNYLVAVFALGLPLSYLYLSGVWRRVALLASALVVAALSNGVRVALIGMLAYFEIGSPLHGPFHVLHGLFVAGIGYVVLFAGLRLLGRGAAHAPRRLPVRQGPPGPLVSLPAAAVVVAMFLGLGSNVLARPAHAITLDGGFAGFPMRLGAWTAIPDVRPDRIAASLWPGADVELSRRYQRWDGAHADLYVGYFESQAPGKQLVSYVATEIHTRAMRVQLTDGDGRPFQANLVAGDGRDGATLFWYDLDAGPETSRYAVKARSIWNSMVSGRSNGTVVALVVRAPGRSSDAVRELGSLVRTALSHTLPPRERDDDRS